MDGTLWHRSIRLDWAALPNTDLDVIKDTVAPICYQLSVYLDVSIGPKSI